MPALTPAEQVGLEPGRATAYLLGLLDDAAALAPVGVPVGPAVAGHRVHRAGDHGLVVGPLHARVSQLGPVLDALDASPSTEPLDLVLVADSGLVEAGEARSILLDDDRVELLGLVVALPTDGPLGDVARLTLGTLDFALPAVIEVPPALGWRDALDVLAADGAERAGFRTGGATTAELAELLVAAVQRPLAFAVTDGPGGVLVDADPSGQVLQHGVLNVLAATAAAVDGRDEDAVRDLLAERDPRVLLAVLAATDPRVVRRRLTSVACSAIGDALVDLRRLGLLDVDG